MNMDQTMLTGSLYKVVNRLKNLQRPDNENEIADSEPDGGKSIGLYKRDFGMEPWDWPQGVGLYGMYSLYKHNSDEEIIRYIENWFAGHLKVELPAENINTTAPFLTLTYLLDQVGDEAESKALNWASYIINELPKTKDNGFQHTTTDNAELRTINLNKDEIWIDTLFMAVLFVSRMGVVAQNRSYMDEAIHQFLVHIKYLYSKETGLFYHGYTFKENNNFGGIFWCRGNSWYTSAVVDFIEIMGSHLDDGTKAFLLDTFKSQVDALVQYQSPCGLWHTVINDEDSYVEVSGSSGFAYGILKAVRLGILDKSYEVYGEKAIQAILSNIDEDGTVLNVSAGTGMGYNKEHYMNIMKGPMAYGQSLVIMALTEALKH